MHARVMKLAEAGQAMWFDYIRRGMFASGELQRLLDDGIVGMTSNPSIFEKAINESSDYDDALETLVEAGKSAQEVYETLAVADIQTAADLLRPIYDKTDARDGYVSLEVNPGLAFDTAGTLAEAQRLWRTVDRANLMIKVPATPAGLPAVRTLIGQGINVNVTLIFACEVYGEVAEAYLAGLEDRVAAGGDPSRVASVASFFVSRVDTLVDGKLQGLIDAGRSELASLQGQAANANAKIAYQMFGEIFGAKRFTVLAEKGARVQRPLWASTSTKNPDYPDTLYVDNLIGPHTVNTLPPATVEAFKDHGAVARTIDAGVNEAHRVIEDLASAGIHMPDVTAQLLDEGVAAFAASFDKLMASLRNRIAVG